MSLRKNVIANYFGQAWSAFMGLAFVPLYIKYLGIESYGVIGVFAMLQTWLAMLDMGMISALGREVARFTGGAHSAQSIRDLLRSIEIVALGIAILIASGIWLSSEWLASHWLKVEKLPLDTVAKAFSIMGMITALRFFENIYRSGLGGLQKQVALNLLNIMMATLKGLGAVGVLIWVSPTIEVFFLWQGILSVFTVILFIYIFYHNLPKTGRRARFSMPALKGIWRYAAGMLGITFLSLLLSQVDKILLSKLITLEAFGYYSLAAVTANGLFNLAMPIAQAFFPHFSKLIANEDKDQLVDNFHKSAQMVSVAFGSTAIFVMVFAEPILQLWTQDDILVQRSAPLLRLLAFGNLLNGMMWIPYQVQLAYGWTRFSLRVNIISVILIVPAIFWAAPRYGAEGTAWVWAILNAGNLLISYQFMYRKILSGEKWHWYFQDILEPLWWATFSLLLFYWLAPYPISNVMQILWLCGILISCFIMTSFSTPFFRNYFKSIMLNG